MLPIRNLGWAQLSDSSIPLVSVISLSVTQPADGLVWRDPDGFTRMSGALAGRTGPARTASQSPYMSPPQHGQTAYKFQKPGSKCCKAFSHLALGVPAHHFCCIQLVKRISPPKILGQTEATSQWQKCKDPGATSDLPHCP